MNELELKTSDEFERLSSAFGPPFKVEAKTYISDYYQIAPDTLYMQRAHFWKEAAREIDCFPRFWTLTFCNFDKGQLGLQSRGQIIPVVGKRILLIPNFNLVEWVLGAGLIQWSALVTTRPLPDQAPRLAQMYDWPENLDILNMTDILQWLSTAEPLCPIDRREKSSAVAEQMKEQIDQCFDQSLKLGELILELGYNHSVVDREFKSCFGLTPLAYRNKMRLFEAQSLLLFRSLSVNQTAQEVGFSDSSHLGHHYSQLIKASPSSFNRGPISSLKTGLRR